MLPFCRGLQCEIYLETVAFWFPFTADYIMIPFYSGLNYEISLKINILRFPSTADCTSTPSTEGYSPTSFYRGLQGDPCYWGLHCDSFVERIDLGNLFEGNRDAILRGRESQCNTLGNDDAFLYRRCHNVIHWMKESQHNSLQAEYETPPHGFTSPIDLPKSLKRENEEK